MSLSLATYFFAWLVGVFDVPWKLSAALGLPPVVEGVTESTVRMATIGVVLMLPAGGSYGGTRTTVMTAVVVLSTDFRHRVLLLGEGVARVARLAISGGSGAAVASPAVAAGPSDRRLPEGFVRRSTRKC